MGRKGRGLLAIKMQGMKGSVEGGEESPPCDLGSETTTIY